MNSEQIERFLDKVSPQENGCWYWTGSNSGRDGYGRVRHLGKMIGAHRVAYEHWICPIPDDLYVCHSCDMPCCVNPDHLWLGTQSDNLLDAYEKNRKISRGESAGNHRLTVDQVRAIRADTRSRNLVAPEYDISPAQVSNIRARRQWKSVE